MKNWITYNLADICKNIYSGGTPSTKHPEYWGGNLKWLSSGETSQKFIYDTQRKITEAGVNNSSTKLAHKNSVVIATAGQGYTRGQVSFLMTDTYMNQSVIACQPDERKVLPLYLYYNLDSRYAELRLLSDGTSTRGGLSGRILKKMEILLPSIEEQSKIVAMLYSLDKKVEINESINKNLEKQALSIYKAWFCDYILSNGIRPSTWASTTIKDLSSLIVRGITPQYEENTNQLVLNQKCIREHAINIALARHHRPKQNNKKWIMKGDLLINSTGTGTLGRVAQVWFEPQNMTVDSHITIVRPKKAVLQNYIGFWGLSHEDEIEALHTGSTGQTELPRERVQALSLLLPCLLYTSPSPRDS